MFQFPGSFHVALGETTESAASPPHRVRSREIASCESSTCCESAPGTLQREMRGDRNNATRERAGDSSPRARCLEPENDGGVGRGEGRGRERRLTDVREGTENVRGEDGRGDRGRDDRTRSECTSYIRFLSRSRSRLLSTGSKSELLRL